MVHGVAQCYMVLYMVLHGVNGCYTVAHSVFLGYRVLHGATRCNIGLDGDTRC